MSKSNQTSCFIDRKDESNHHTDSGGLNDFLVSIEGYLHLLEAGIDVPDARLVQYVTWTKASQSERQVDHKTLITAQRGDGQQKNACKQQDRSAHFQLTITANANLFKRVFL